MAEAPRVRVVNKDKEPGPGFMPGWNTKVYVDDVNISDCLESVRVDVTTKGLVTATLVVYVNEVEFDGVDVLQIGASGPDLLIKHGWTPPNDHPAD